MTINISFERLDDVETVIARYMAVSKVVVRYNGHLEYVPRDWGNRLIIASPFDQTINDWLNKKLNPTEEVIKEAEKLNSFISRKPQQ